MKKMVLAALLAASCSAFAADGANLLKNPGFEEDGSWLVWGTQKGFSAEDRAALMTFVTAADAPEGKRYLKCADIWKDGRPYLIQFVDLPTLAPSYLLKFKAKAPDATEFRSGVMFNKGTLGDQKTYTFVANKLAVFKGTGEWKEYWFKIDNITPGTNVFAVVLGATTGEITETNTVLFDDVSLIAE